MRMKSVVRVSPLIVMAVLLAGCAVPHPARVQAGMDEREVIAAMGPPTNRYPMPGGATRLEFATGPAGRETWMVDLDASGRVKAIDQVLDVRHFLAVPEGTDGATLLRTLGRPAWVQGEYRGRRTWYWRYYNNDCLVAAATLSAQGKLVGGVAQMTDPACERRER